MNARTATLRRQSLDTPPSLTAERAVLLTDFYQANAGLFSVPILRAKSFLHLCQHKTLYLGAGELIVGERGPAPKVVPTFPELTCHSVEDLKILNSRPKTWYRVDDETIRLYAEKVIPYWRGRSLRDQIFAALPAEWHAAYEAGMFTEFMEQRAPGHTVLDDKIYAKGLREFKADIAQSLAALDFLQDTAGVRPARDAPVIRPGVRCSDRVRPAARGAGPGTGGTGKRPGAARGTRPHRASLRARAGKRAAQFPRGAPVLLVLPPGRHHGIERLGFL